LRWTGLGCSAATGDKKNMAVLLGHHHAGLGGLNQAAELTGLRRMRRRQSERGWGTASRLRALAFSRCWLGYPLLKETAVPATRNQSSFCSTLNGASDSVNAKDAEERTAPQKLSRFRELAGHRTGHVAGHFMHANARD
jgi:hypothetical protein